MSDQKQLEELTARVSALEVGVVALAERLEGKELHGELYGAEVNHTEDREARARPGRPPKATF